MFPYITGVSAGAANALSYVSGQRGRNREIVEKYVSNHRYVSSRNLILHGSLFGYDFIFDTIPNRHIFWDRAAFNRVDIRFLTGATDCATGGPVWFEKQNINEDFLAARASCSVPFFSKIVTYNGLELLDGGVSAPIPIEKSVSDSNDFHVIVLTRNAGYRKSAFRYKSLIKLFYGKYPNLVDALMNRHVVYNRQLEMCESLEREGKAIIIRPQKPLAATRTSADTGMLLALHDEGHEEGAQAVREIMLRYGD